MKAIYSMVGMKFRGAEKFVASLPRGEPLSLVREPDNKHDRNAVQVWARGQHVAYVKATEAAALARRMDKTSSIDAGFLTFGAERWPMVEVDE